MYKCPETGPFERIRTIFEARLKKRAVVGLLGRCIAMESGICSGVRSDLSGSNRSIWRTGAHGVKCITMMFEDVSKLWVLLVLVSTVFWERGIWGCSTEVELYGSAYLRFVFLAFEEEVTRYHRPSSRNWRAESRIYRLKT